MARKSKKSKTKGSNNAPRKSRASATQNNSSISPYVGNISRRVTHGNVVHDACSITNPFCAAAKGAKFPDDVAIPTLAFQQHGLIAVSVNASGNGAALFTPGFSYQYAVDSTVTVPAVPAYTNLSSITGASLSPNKYRLTSWGIRIKSIAAPLNASGMVHIRCFNITGSQLSTINATAYTAAYAVDVPLRLCDDVCVISKPTSRTFWNMTDPATTNPTAAVTDFTNPGWTCLSVYVSSGPASSTPVTCEVFYNYELGFADDQSQSLLSTSNPTPKPLVTTLSSYVYSKMSPIMTQGVKYVEDTLWNIASSYVSNFSVNTAKSAAMMLTM